MFKILMTMFRGASHEAAETFTDQHAVPILRQQVREASAAVLTAKKSVALAIAQNEQELAQNEMLRRRLHDLEQRARDALTGDKPELAYEAAQAIAILEDELSACEAAQNQFQTHIAGLKHKLRTAESRLRDIQRGQRLATATATTLRLQNEIGPDGPSSLADAERTLARLTRRQQELERSAEILETFDIASNPEKVAEKLADAGCGAPRRTSAEDVLARLRKQAVASKKA